MSEPAGTETTAAPPAAGPRQFTAEELDAARAQLLAQGGDLTPAQGASPPVDGSELGMQALAAGAEPDEVDTRALLASIQAMQAQIDGLQAEKKLATAPEVVKYATALADHLQARADMHPVIHADPDHTWMPVLERAADLVNAAQESAKTGDPAGLEKITADIRRFVTRHARRFPSIDYGYIQDLADETDDAAAKLAA